MKKTFNSFKISKRNLDFIFSDCEDFETRLIVPGGGVLRDIHVCWIDGIVSGDAVSSDVIKPLTSDERFARALTDRQCLDLVFNGGVYFYSVKRRERMDDLVSDLVHGFCAVVSDSLGLAVTLETKTDNSRSISEPTVEKTVKGAKDAFVETLRTNTSLVRRKLRDPDLKMQQVEIGRRSSTQVAVMYMSSIADSAFVQEALRRLRAIDIDGLTGAGAIEQYITDCPASPFPQLIHTERPDRFAAELLSGRVGIIADGLPLGFIAPANMAEFMKVGEDRSQHFAVSTLLILLRWLSLFLSVLLPAIFVAVAMYHAEMLPYKLLISMIDAKQQVPFSVAIEVLSMLVAFELLQEAGVRLPNPVGDTVSIIGALIVGQSAVEARVVSPVAVIVVATAGICGYTLPSQDMGSALRLWRFLAVGAAIALGLYGVMLLLALTVWHLSSIESFGVGYLAPLSEGGFLASLKSVVQPPLYLDRQRPHFLHPKDVKNQK